MRTTLSLTLCLLLFFTSRAQNRASSPTTTDFPRWSFSVMAGPAFPVGKFASKSATDAESGHAQPGFNLELGLHYRLNRSFGLSFEADGQDNAVGDFNSAGNAGGSQTSYTVHNHHWKIARFLAGGQFVTPLNPGKGPLLQIRALAGVLKTSLPGFDYTFQSGAGTVPETGHAADYPLGWAFAYQADAGLKWRVSPKTLVGCSVGYAGADARIQYPYTFFSNNAVLSSVQSTKRAVPTGSIQLRIGVEIGL